MAPVPRTTGGPRRVGAAPGPAPVVGQPQADPDGGRPTRTARSARAGVSATPAPRNHSTAVVREAPRCERWTPVKTLWGDPATTICAVAKTHPCELMVMSTHGRTGLAHVFIGSVTERVVRYAPCAVLIVRAFPEQQP